MSPPPNFDHSITASDLVTLFANHLHNSHDRGRLFVPRAALWTASATYVEPDLFYVSAQTLAQTDRRKPDKADLVVEIVSPNTAIYDRNTKADTYAALGVRELWLVDTANEIIEVRNLLPNENCYGIGVVFKRGEQVESKILPTFAPSVSRICNAAKS